MAYFYCLSLNAESTVSLPAIILLMQLSQAWHEQCRKRSVDHVVHSHELRWLQVH